ncbi:MAG: hypothetical protein OXG09_02290 [Chloroflexi bacterium]|nr:hypothetical protein [Chloroflexota bacterium]
MTDKETEKKIARLDWLSSKVEKHIDRSDATRRSLYHKAGWTFIAATSFVTLSGFARSDAIRIAFSKFYTAFANENWSTIETHEKLITAIVFLLLICYGTLYRLVAKVFAIDKIPYSIELASRGKDYPASQYENREMHKDYIDSRWRYAVEKYIKPDDLELSRYVLYSHISALAELDVFNNRRVRYQKDALKLLSIIALLSFLLFFFV